MSEKSIIDYEKMASFNVMFFDILEKNTFQESFLSVLNSYKDERKKYAYGNNTKYFSLVEKVEEIHKNNTTYYVIWLKKYKPATDIGYDLNTHKIGDEYESRNFLDNDKLGIYNIALYDTSNGVLSYNENQNATSYKTFLNLINTNNIINTVIDFSIRLNKNIDSLSKFKEVKYNKDTAGHDDKEYINEMILNDFDAGTISINIKAKRNSFLNTSRVQNFIKKHQDLPSLTAEYHKDDSTSIDDGNGLKKIFNLVNDKLSYPSIIDDGSQLDYVVCRDKIIEIYEKAVLNNYDKERFNKV